MQHTDSRGQFSPASHLNAIASNYYPEQLVYGERQQGLPRSWKKSWSNNHRTILTNSEQEIAAGRRADYFTLRRLRLSTDMNDEEGTPYAVVPRRMR
jgi:hypothetical protein